MEFPAHESLCEVSKPACILVIAAYIIYAIGQIVLIRDAARSKSYGMPPVSSSSFIGIAFACVIGPWTNQSHLFYPKERWETWLVWFGSLLLQLVIYWQWLRHARVRREKQLLKRAGTSTSEHELNVTRYWLGILSPVISFAFVWSFIVFYQDWYVNEIFPLVTLFMAIGFVGELFFRESLLGLSVAAAWLYTVALALMYSGFYAGGMDYSFPNAEHGYGLIYLAWTLGVAWMFFYSVGLTRRRAETIPDKEGLPATQ